jgi:glyoxylase-like metal-dependent hydrolase (beta-lactamase superfamily II)
MSIRVHSIKAGLAWCHLIENEHGLVLVDAGSTRQEGEILRRMEALGRSDLRLILITHAHLDHYGSAAALQKETRAPVAIHAADEADMAKGKTRLGAVRLFGRVVKAALPLVERRLRPEPTRADVILSDGSQLDEYGLPARILHTPGHTPGSCSLIVEGGIAFVGDLVSPMVWPHAQLFYAHDWPELARSLEAVQTLRPRWVYSGHGGSPIAGNVFQKIRARA